MYATAAPALLFIIFVATLSLSISCGNQMAAEGLPIGQEHGAQDNEDIIAGNDFLSVFLGTSLRRARKETTRATEESVDILQETTVTEPSLRTSRQADSYVYEVPQNPHRQLNKLNSSDFSSSDGVIIAVHVSSSVGSQINKNSHEIENDLDESTTHVPSENILVSEDHPSIIVESNKSELDVEEPAPIINKNIDVNPNDDVNSDLQARIPTVSGSHHLSFNPSRYINSQNKNSLSPPFSFIYHDNPQTSGRARSVSYSSLIQEISPLVKKSETHERKERNYVTGSGYRNSLESPKNNIKVDTQDANTESSKSSIYSSSSTTQTSTNSWIDRKEESTNRDSSRKTNWGNQYNPMPIAQQLPKVYGKSEQNYEVDEAVSVETYGRTHGSQEIPVAPTTKTKNEQDKDQKVGYVVEGRNYRKYRVEERTSDGFIVGEYGVVSHNDGSLRGVRYTADGTINPRLIYDALMKFLAL